MSEPFASITLDQLEDGHALILGTTGSGKTYQLRGLLELLRRANRRVGAIDKLGNHWGLTLAADGKAPGLEFVIFGGKRAHVPMQPGDGARIARLFVTRNIPALFDVSQWHGDDQQRWVAAFADTVFHLNDGALHLALDEAQSWVPQGGGGEAFRAVQRLAEQGRGNGLRLALTCQRLARLDATVREMMNLVVVMRQKSTIDRKAVAELVAETPADLELLKRLPKLPTGTGLIWSADRDGLLPCAFPPNATFDSSRTPRHGDTAPAPIGVSSALVEELKALLAPEKSKGDQPDDMIPAEPGEAYAKGSVIGSLLVERDARIADLEAANVLLTATAEEVARDRDKWLNQHRFRGEVLARLQAEQNILKARLDMIRHALDVPSPPTRSQAKPGVEAATHDKVVAVEPGSRPAAGRSAAAGAEIMAPPKPSPARKRVAAAEGPHPLAERIVAKLEELAPARLTWKQLATLLAYKPSGGYFRTAKREALASGRIVDTGIYVAATNGETPEGGLCKAAAFAMWRKALPAPAGAIMDVLDEFGVLSREELAARLGYQPTGGFFRGGLAHLRQNEVIVDAADSVRFVARLPGEGKGT